MGNHPTRTNLTDRACQSPFYTFLGKYIITLQSTQGFTLDPKELKQPDNYTHICIFYTSKSTMNLKNYI